MSNPFRRLASVVALVAVASATLATQPGMPTARSVLTLPIDLGRDHSVVARRIRAFIDHGGNDPASSSLLVADANGSEVNPAIWVSLVPEDASEPTSTAGDYVASYSEQDLTEVCADGCERSYIVLVRSRDPSGGVVTDSLSIELSARYRGEGMAPPGSVARLTADTEPVDIAGQLRVVRVGALEVGSNEALATWKGELRVSRSALLGTNTHGYPLVGRVHVAGTSTETGDSPPGNVMLSVGEQLLSPSPPEPEFPMAPLEIDWLPACNADADCTVPIELRFEQYPDFGGTVRFEYQLEISLLYLDGSSPPTDAQLTIENERTEQE